jgi:hypothetical protein
MFLGINKNYDLGVGIAESRLSHYPRKRGELGVNCELLVGQSKSNSQIRSTLIKNQKIKKGVAPHCVCPATTSGLRRKPCGMSGLDIVGGFGPRMRLPEDPSNPEADVCGPTLLSGSPELSKRRFKQTWLLVGFSFREFGLVD